MHDPLERLEQLVSRLEELPALRAPDGVVLEQGQHLEFQLKGMTTLEGLERAYVRFVLRRCSGNKTEAAQILGIDPSTLYRKLERYGTQSI